MSIITFHEPRHQGGCLRIPSRSLPYPTHLFVMLIEISVPEQPCGKLALTFQNQVINQGDDNYSYMSDMHSYMS